MPRVLPPAPPGLESLLVGRGVAGPEARLRFGGGVLAGTELRVRAEAGRVSVALLTGAESARQTLSVVMSEVGRRLAQRGIDVNTKAASSPPGPRAGDRAPREHR